MLPFKILDSVPHDRVKLSAHKKGSLRELRLCSYLVEQGYETFRNVTPDGIIDIIAVDKDTMTTHYIDSKSPLFSQKDGTLTNKIGILSKEQKEKGIKGMIYYEEKIFYVDKNNYNLKEFIRCLDTK
jgi:hypothetical protein